MALDQIFPLPDDDTPQLIFVGSPIATKAWEVNDGAGFTTYRIEMTLDLWDRVALTSIREIVKLVTPGKFNTSLAVDLSAYVESAWDAYESQLPTGTGWDLTVMKVFRVRAVGYGDGVYDDEFVQQFLAVNGYPGESFRLPNGSYESLNIGWGNGDRFFTHSPEEKMTTPFAEEYLYTPKFGLLSCIPHYVAEYLDGTESPEMTLPVVSGIAAGLLHDLRHMLRVSVGYAALGLGALPKQVKSWRVWITDEFITTEVKRFTLDCYENSEHGRYFLFRNSFGTWDTIYLTGVQRTAMRITGDTIEMQNFPLEGDAYGRNTVVTNRRFQREADLASGYFLPGHAAMLTDLAGSREVFLRNEGDRESLSQYRPVTMIRGTLQIAEDARDLDFFSLQYIDQILHPGL